MNDSAVQYTVQCHWQCDDSVQGEDSGQDLALRLEADGGSDPIGNRK